MSGAVTAHGPGQGAVSHAWALDAFEFATPVVVNTNLLICLEVSETGLDRW